jgi:REP element-mobilizing transposase RayT
MYEPSDSDVKCPVANEVRKLFSEAKALKESGTDKEAADQLQDIALAHWIKYSYLFQGFILEGGGESVNPAINVPLRLPKSMFTLINHSIVSADSGFDTLPIGEYMPEHIQHILEGTMPEDMSEEEFVNLFNGRNYIIRKTKKGEHFNYETSGWDMKESSLTDEQIEHLGKEGFIDLRKYLPKRPTDEQYEVFTEMVQTNIAHARGESDGVWNAEWETVGIKPNKGKEEGGSSEEGDEEGGSKRGGNLKTNLANRLKGGASTTGADGVRNKLQAARGAASASKPAESVAAETKEETTEHPASSGGSEPANQVMSLAERLKKKKAEAAQQ